AEDGHVLAVGLLAVLQVLVAEESVAFGALAGAASLAIREGAEAAIAALQRRLAVDDVRLQVLMLGHAQLARADLVRTAAQPGVARAEAAAAVLAGGHLRLMAALEHAADLTDTRHRGRLPRWLPAGYGTVWFGSSWSSSPRLMIPWR